MLGLVAYGSDSEEEERVESLRREEPTAAPLMKVGEAPPTSGISSKVTVDVLKGDLRESPISTQGRLTDNRAPANGSPELATRPQDTEEIGPIMGPSRPPRTPSPAPQTPYSPNPEQLSPYSLNRATIRSLTFPTSIPDIPASPPGDEPPDVAAKFDHFRQLKRQGIHFNEKLLRSEALRNPNLLEKLTAFVGVGGTDQYASNLPKEIWDPTAFQEDAFAVKLAKSQQEVLENRQAEERSKIEFVRAAPPPGVSITMPPVSQDRKAAGSAAERVMAGLNRERKPNIPPMDPSKRRDERRIDGKWDNRDKDRTRDRRRDDDQHQKRRRSRTRSRSRSKEESGRYRDYEPRR